MRTAVEVTDLRPRTAPWWIALSGAMVGLGGVLLGLQIDGNGRLTGTGFTALAIGALLALVATLVRVGIASRLPRDSMSVFAAATGFLGLAFVFSGVLAPGGPWMFFEMLVLLLLVARKRQRDDAPDRWLGTASLWALGAMLLFRLWITYQGSQHRWQLVTIQIPVLSWIPLDWLAPIQSVALGSFTPQEMGFPPAGLNFPVTMTLWAVGFCLCAVGLLVSQNALREHENDRIHELIHTLPSALARLVERLLPEEEWRTLGLHGLGERVLSRKIERLVEERVARQRDLAVAFEKSGLLSLTNPGGFSGSIYQALISHDPRRSAESSPRSEEAAQRGG